jgi:hypothetical protein
MRTWGVLFLMWGTAVAVMLMFNYGAHRKGKE